MSSVPVAIPNGIPTYHQREAVNIPFTLTLAQTNVPVQCPAFTLPAGCTVRVRAHNGQPEGNLAPIHVGTSAIAALTGPCEVLGPNTEIQFPVDNTSQIWISGTAEDGAIVTIKG
jgi:hypothetical protein